jgi:hypothetical protein
MESFLEGGQGPNWGCSAKGKKKVFKLKFPNFALSIQCEISSKSFDELWKLKIVELNYLSLYKLYVKNATELCTDEQS